MSTEMSGVGDESRGGWPVSRESVYRGFLIRALKNPPPEGIWLDDYIKACGVDRDVAQRVAEDLYGIFARKVVADGVISPDERRKLDKLALVLRVNPIRAREVEQSAGSEIYRGALAEAVADGIVTPEEAAHLADLQGSLDISEAEVNSAVRAVMGSSPTPNEGALSETESDKATAIVQKRGFLPDWAQPILVGLIVALPIALCMVILLRSEQPGVVAAKTSSGVESPSAITQSSPVEAPGDVAPVTDTPQSEPAQVTEDPPADPSSPPLGSYASNLTRRSAPSPRLSVPIPRSFSKPQAPPSQTAPQPAPFFSWPSGSSSSSDSGDKTVSVRGYYRKNGTYVQPHMRSAPSRRR